MEEESERMANVMDVDGGGGNENWNYLLIEGLKGLSHSIQNRQNGFIFNSNASICLYSGGFFLFFPAFQLFVSLNSLLFSLEAK